VEENANGGGWNDLLATFRSNGLPDPPVPVTLRPGLLEMGPWHWGTGDAGSPDPREMYFFRPALIAPLLVDGVPDTVVLCHSGHGANSYAITYRLRYRRLVLLAQVHWGGVYTDEEKQTAALADVFLHCQALIDRIEEFDPSPVGDAQDGQKLVCLQSDMRGIAGCGWTFGASRSDDHYPVSRVERGTALAAALRLLDAGCPAGP
jgi:hypothetical protein